MGDIVTVVGKRGQYKTTIEMTSPTLESVKNVETVSIADFRSKTDDKTTYYLISGTVGKSTEAGAKFDLDTYGNFALTDATSSVYIYGVSTGWNGWQSSSAHWGVKEGDTLTILAYKTSYKGNHRGCGYILV